jgi:hypothetical protein
VKFKVGLTSLFLLSCSFSYRLTLTLLLSCSYCLTVLLFLLLSYSYCLADLREYCCCCQGRAYVRASPGPCRCFILKLSCHSINISVGLRELENSLHRGAVASFQLEMWDDVIFLGPARCTFVVCRRFFFAMLNSLSIVVCRRLVAILDPPLVVALTVLIVWIWYQWLNLSLIFSLMSMSPHSNYVVVFTVLLCWFVSMLPCWLVSCCLASLLVCCLWLSRSQAVKFNDVRDFNCLHT